MKTISLSFFFLFTFSCFAQLKNCPEVSRATTPAVVTDNFTEKYTDVTVSSWKATHISYWYNDYIDEWYTNWYPQRKELEYAFTEANFYQVTFSNSKHEVSKALYSKYGYWHETRTHINELPPKVLKGLGSSVYSNWLASDFKEKVETVGNPESYYRLMFTKGVQKHIVRFSPKGEVIQIKKLTSNG